MKIDKIFKIDKFYLFIGLVYLIILTVQIGQNDSKWTKQTVP